MAVTLEPFQERALSQLRSGNVLVGEVGSGKSIVAIMWWLRMCCRTRSGESGSGRTLMPLKGSPDLLIITEAKKRDKAEWGEDLIKFGLHIGTNKPSGVEITVDSWQRIKAYHDFHGVIIFDEQHATGTGVWSKEFIHIAKAQGNRWILLSATPADSYEDLIPIFVANGFYKNKTQFMTMHAVYDRWAKYPKVNDWRNTDILEKLKRRIMVPMKRPKNRGPSRNPVYQIVVDHDKQALKTLRKERKDPWTGEPLKNVSQYCFAQRKLVNSDPSRIKETMDICIRHPKIVIFYNYDFELEELLSLRRRTGIPVYQYNGHHHDDIPQDGDWIYLVNYGSGAAGWNCTQTDTMLFYSLNYSYRIMEQAAGRIDRINSPFKELNYYILRSFAPIDSAILRALANKETFNERTFASKDISGKED